MSEHEQMNNQAQESTPKPWVEIWGKIWKILKAHTLQSILIAMGLVIVILLVYINLSVKDQPVTKTTISSVLKDVLDIDELSVSSFTYNGIADIHDSSTHKVDYSVLYHATVKAGISLSNITFNVDDESKVIHIQLPEIKIQDVVVDPAHVDFIPDRAEIHMATALATCRSDALREATESEELIDAARDNLKSVVEALTWPIVTDTGYTLEW